MWSALLTIAFLPLVHPCAPSTGGLSKTALLQFSLSPPPKYTYNDPPLFGQMITADAAEKNADRDLRSAIVSTLTENGIMENSVTLSYEFAAPKLDLAESDHCVEPNTYVVYQGAILYKCVASTLRAARRKARAAGDETTTDASTATEESTTSEPSTTVSADASTTSAVTDASTTSAVADASTTSAVADASTTSAPEATTTTETTTTSAAEASTTAEPAEATTAADSTTANSEPLTTDGPDPTAAPGGTVKTTEFHISGTVTVETAVPIFEDQWKSFAEKIQAKLEKQNVYFTEDVVVDLV
ncbi:unnamed protein product [Heligmosomoides polygyrus]|uniref:SEA domain-containing protein n=1 Tax=Heligmosomoides polygyrus TaxID=6339 RepID=A0A183FZW1_HELPZ|nr:unnamed protein product [Heligmosomoides polygyrus]